MEFIIGGIAMLFGFIIIGKVISLFTGKPKTGNDDIMKEVEQLRAENEVRAKEIDAYFKEHGLRK